MVCGHHCRSSFICVAVGLHLFKNTDIWVGVVVCRRVYVTLLYIIKYCRWSSDWYLLLRSDDPIKPVRCQGLGRVQGRCCSDHISASRRSVRFLQYVHDRATLDVFCTHTVSVLSGSNDRLCRVNYCYYDYYYYYYYYYHHHCFIVVVIIVLLLYCFRFIFKVPLLESDFEVWEINCSTCSR